MRQPPGGLDQYYAFTARLAAAGQQATAMRVVRVCLIGLSIAPLLAAFNPASTIGARGQLLLAAIFLACGFLAVPWLRYRWPTRTESMMVVVIGSIIIARRVLDRSRPDGGTADRRRRSLSFSATPPCSTIPCSWCS